MQPTTKITRGLGKHTALTVTAALVLSIAATAQKTAERLRAIQAKEAQMLRVVEAGVVIPQALVAQLEARGVEVIE